MKICQQNSLQTSWKKLMICSQDTFDNKIYFSLTYVLMWIMFAFIYININIIKHVLNTKDVE